MNLVQFIIMFAVAPMPIVEMRLAIALGLYRYHVSPLSAFAIAAAANILAIPLIWALLPQAEALARRSPRVARFLDRLYAKVRHESTKGKVRLEAFGVFTILALTGVPFPLPGSGLYTAIIAAYIFGLPFKRTFLWASAGAIVACAALTIAGVLGRRIYHGI